MNKVASALKYLEARIAAIAKDCRRNPTDIQLVAVSKTFPIDLIQQAYEAGCRDFGENRIQEVLEKMPLLSSDIRWHFIGTLQANKVNKAVGAFHLIHSVDSLELANKISTVSEKKGVITPILLEVNTSGEETKHGLSVEEWRNQVKAVDQLPGLSLEGLMAMAPLTEDKQAIRECFRSLRQLRDDLKDQVRDSVRFHHLSMGMSHDYEIAIQEGATLLRIGTAIFGKDVDSQQDVQDH